MMLRTGGLKGGMQVTPSKGRLLKKAYERCPPPLVGLFWFKTKEYMKIQGNVASLNVVDRHMLNLPRTCHDEYVARLPIDTALVATQDELRLNSDASSGVKPPEEMFGYAFQRAALQWKYRRLQKIAGVVLAYETEEMLKGNA
jgi:hypothetical protein